MAGINFKNLDLNLLIVFEAIYSAGNIGHAANHLAMSQPAVSNALARLRDLIGDPLLVRANRGVEPTSKTKQMIGPVRDALALPQPISAPVVPTASDACLGTIGRQPDW
jgi:DNA-binding transcriptional LysR family regulator